MDSTIRYCKDIALWAIDRPRTTCKHATTFCAATCFNIKLERAFGHVINPKDTRNESYWQQLTGQQLSDALATKRNQPKRFRLMTRGEAFSTVEDIDRVRDIITHNPTILFWIPTRAWRNTTLCDRIESEILTLPNARVQASLDPSNSREETQNIIGRGWSTMFYGDDSATNGRYLCQKTHKHKVGACKTCRSGCFSKKQTHVHLKQH